MIDKSKFFSFSRKRESIFSLSSLLSLSFSSCKFHHYVILLSLYFHYLIFLSCCSLSPIYAKQNTQHLQFFIILSQIYSPCIYCLIFYSFLMRINFLNVFLRAIIRCILYSLYARRDSSPKVKGNLYFSFPHLCLAFCAE